MAGGDELRPYKSDGEARTALALDAGAGQPEVRKANIEKSGDL
jgi:hypothetical protein